MSKQPNVRSKEELVGPTTDSVYDFLYHDSRRIASLLAQFDPNGHLTQLSYGRSANRGKESASHLDASGGLPGLAKVDSKNSETVKSAHQEELLRVYDPTWANARLLLDLLDERKLINRDPSTARFGQIVLCSGKLSFLDLRTLQAAWGMKSVQAMIRGGAEPAQSSGNRRDRRKAAAQGLSQKSTAPDPTEFMLDYIPSMPHTLQVNLMGKERVWCTLDLQGISTEPSHLILKHGASIPGDWSILGILDAKPDADSGSAEDTAESFDADEIVANVTKMMAPLIRTFMGRPESAYGVTPLLLFRQVGE
jgi:hypothetical protein